MFALLRFTGEFKDVSTFMEELKNSWRKNRAR